MGKRAGWPSGRVRDKEGKEKIGKRLRSAIDKNKREVEVCGPPIPVYP
jgi:hypothetical protein